MIIMNEGGTHINSVEDWFENAPPAQYVMVHENEFERTSSTEGDFGEVDV